MEVDRHIVQRLSVKRSGLDGDVFGALAGQDAKVAVGFAVTGPEGVALAREMQRNRTSKVRDLSGESVMDLPCLRDLWYLLISKSCSRPTLDGHWLAQKSSHTLRSPTDQQHLEVTPHCSPSEPRQITRTTRE